MHSRSALARWVHVRWLVTALGSALAFLILISLRQAGYLQSLELSAYDAFIRLQPSSGQNIPIVLIGVTETDIQELRQWPLSDAMLAEVLDTLIGYEPRAIGLDIYRDIPVSPGTEQLERVLLENDQIIVVEKAPSVDGTGIPAPNVLRNSTRIGFNDVVPDPAGVVRRALLFLDYGSSTSYSFGLRLALRYLATEGISPEPGHPDPTHLRLGSTTLSPLQADYGSYVDIDASGYQIMLTYKGGAQPFSTYSLTDLRSGRLPKDSLQDKIVLLGVISESVKDTFYTPYDTYANRQGIPGIGLHAHVANQLLLAGQHGVAPRQSLGNISEILWILFWSMFGGFLGLTVRFASAFAGLVIGGLAVLATLAYGAFAAGWWIPLVPPAFGWVASSSLTAAYLYSQERWERGLLMEVFSKNVSREVAEAIWNQRQQIFEGGRIRSEMLTATVLFSDIQGFTSISEKLGPQELMDWLNKYMASMTRLVMQHGGLVDDYAGDGIKANFGVPFARVSESGIKQDALNAVRCALSMQQELRNLNRLWEDNGLPAVRMRVGVNTGIAVAGTLGSAERLKYTTVGDAVNVAARLESVRLLPQEFGAQAEPLCRILVSEETHRHLGGTFQAECLGSFSVKGRAQAVSAYLITGATMDCNVTPVEEEKSCITSASR
jgi:adenylate cyclase